MRRYAPLALCLLALAACSKAPEQKAADTPVANADVKADIVKAATFMAGKWEHSTTITALDAPGMPPQVKDAMNKAMKRTVTSTDCITKEQAEKNAEEMFKKSAEGMCKYQRFSMSGGQINAAMTCEGGEGGGTTDVTMTGVYTADSYKTQLKMNASMPKMPGGAMSMSATGTGRRIGECS